MCAGAEGELAGAAGVQADDRSRRLGRPRHMAEGVRDGLRRLPAAKKPERQCARAAGRPMLSAAFPGGRVRLSK